MDKNLHIVTHPLVQHKLALLRDKETSTNKFRDLLREISLLMGYELLRDLPTEEVEIETPLEKTKARKLAGKKLCIVSILRGGNGLVDGLLELMPSARVGHIGLYRDPETLGPVEYYLKFPDDLPNRKVVIVNPMLATGHSAVAAISRVHGADATDIRFLCIVASPEGIATVRESYPDVPIYTAAVDRSLTENGFILPGIGDAGDRIFGTK
jgi:uracil phosphoribosyltransferase